MNIVDILGLAGVGIAFLLAYLAYKLIVRISELENPNPALLARADRFMIFSISIGAIAMLAQGYNNYIKRPAPQDLSEDVSQLIARTEDLDERLQVEENEAPPAPRDYSLIFGESESIRIQGGSQRAAACPDGHVLTGISGSDRVGGDIAGLALYRIDFECKPLTLIAE